jgi:hypothetical protein
MTEKILEYVALASRVLVVAVKGEVKDDWAAYCDSVSGVSHEIEKYDVVRNGSKISKELAEFMFPEIAKVYKWRN